MLPDPPRGLRLQPGEINNGNEQRGRGQGVAPQAPQEQGMEGFGGAWSCPSPRGDPTAAPQVPTQPWPS